MVRLDKGGQKVTHGDGGLAIWRQPAPAEGSVSGCCVLCLPRCAFQRIVLAVYVFGPPRATFLFYGYVGRGSFSIFYVQFFFFTKSHPNEPHHRIIHFSTFSEAVLPVCVTEAEDLVPGRKTSG